MWLSTACPGSCSLILDRGGGFAYHLNPVCVAIDGQAQSVAGSAARHAAGVSMSSQLTLYGDDELRDDGQDLVGSSTEHIVHALLREKRVGHLQLAEPVEEDWQVVVEIQLQRRGVVRSHTRRFNDEPGKTRCGSWHETFFLAIITC